MSQPHYAFPKPCRQFGFSTFVGRKVEPPLMIVTAAEVTAICVRIIR